MTNILKKALICFKKSKVLKSYHRFLPLKIWQCPTPIHQFFFNFSHIKTKLMPNTLKKSIVFCKKSNVLKSYHRFLPLQIWQCPTPIHQFFDLSHIKTKLMTNILKKKCCLFFSRNPKF